jgi:hypothetical protein
VVVGLLGPVLGYRQGGVAGAGGGGPAVAVPALGCLSELLVDVEPGAVDVDPATQPWPGTEQGIVVISAASSSAVINRA